MKSLLRVMRRIIFPSITLMMLISCRSKIDTQFDQHVNCIRKFNTAQLVSTNSPKDRIIIKNRSYSFIFFADSPPEIQKLTGILCNDRQDSWPIGKEFTDDRGKKFRAEIEEKQLVLYEFVDGSITRKVIGIPINRNN